MANFGQFDAENRNNSSFAQTIFLVYPTRSESFSKKRHFPYQFVARVCMCVRAWGWSRGLKHIMFGRIFLIRPLSFDVNATRHALTFLYNKFSVTQNCSYFCHFTCLFHGRQTFSYFNCFNVNSGSIIKRFRWIYLIKYCVFST